MGGWKGGLKLFLRIALGATRKVITESAKVNGDKYETVWIEGWMVNTEFGAINNDFNDEYVNVC